MQADNDGPTVHWGVTLSGSGKKRVLIVDDAVVVRKTLSDAIGADAALEVAGTAANGRLALAKFSALKPDVVLLDIEMPEMDGLETVSELRKLDAHVPIIMFSTLTQRGATATLEALSRGATDYVAKPSNLDMKATLQSISRDVIPKIRAFCHLPETPDTPPTQKSPPSTSTILLAPRPKASGPVQVVAIGVSTGGPNALASLLPSLPANLPVPVLIAQHMPAMFTSLLAARLASKCALPVRECVPGEALSPGAVIIAPGDFHMVLSREENHIRLRTNQEPKENFCRPSADVLFRSVAAVFGGRALAVVLTGMGQDGLKGCEILRGLGSRIYVQDEATSVVWGMPGLVARAGLAEKILPLAEIGAEIVRATAMPSARAVAANGAFPR